MEKYEGTKRTITRVEKAIQARKEEKKKQKEKLSTREIGDLMGIHRPCYERRHGALRQK